MVLLRSLVRLPSISSSPTLSLRTMATNTNQLRKKIAKQYDQALAAGDAFYFPSHVRVLTQPANPQAAAEPLPNIPEDAQPQDREIRTIDIDWVIRAVPSLLEKPTPNAVKPDNHDQPAPDKAQGEQASHPQQPQQNQQDPFAPPYAPNLLISQDEPEGGVVLLNKFCVVPRHALLVTKDFVPQNLPPPPELLAQAYRIVSGFRGEPAEEEMMAFFNCGWESGASQKHCHVQLIEVRRDQMLNEGLDPDEHPPSDDAEGTIPIERLLTSIERDGSEYRFVHALPVQWQHFVALLDQNELKSKGAEPYLMQRLMDLLDTKNQAAHQRVALEQEGQMSSHPLPPKLGSFNLLLSRRALHLVPRSREEYQLPGEWGQVNGKPLGKLSVNAMGYAGMLLVKHPDEVEALAKDPSSVPNILAELGVAPIEGVTRPAHHH